MTATEQNTPHSAEQRQSIAGVLRVLLAISDAGARNDSLHEKLLSLNEGSLPINFILPCWVK